MQAGGPRFESVILHKTFRLEERKFIDILAESSLTCEPHPRGWELGKEKDTRVRKFEKVTKSAWGMPWLSEAMKDVISCDKLRGGANNL